MFRSKTRTTPNETIAKAKKYGTTANAATTVTASSKATKSTSNKVTTDTTATNTKAKELSVYGMIAKKAGVSTNSNGEPYITNKIDSDSACYTGTEYSGEWVHR